MNSLWHIKTGALCIWMYGYPSRLLVCVNILYGMVMLWLNVNTFISSKNINQLERMNKGRRWHTPSIAIGIAKFCANRNKVCFQKVWRLYTVPLNYNFTFTHVSKCGATRGLRGKCQKLPWKASFPRDRPWLFHAKTRGISRHVAFPRDETWNFHDTSSRGISTRPVTV